MIGSEKYSLVLLSIFLRQGVNVNKIDPLKHNGSHGINEPHVGIRSGLILVRREKDRMGKVLTQ